ncbi:MAG: hypothetical protein V3T14_06735 [Myxococcota bacterium]
MSALDSVEWEECLLEPRRDPELEREVRKVLGFVPPTLPYFAHSVWVARNFSSNFRLGQLAHISFDLADLIFLAVSQDNSCRFCYGSQRILLRVLGVEDASLQRLEQASSAAEAEPRERGALEFARRVSRSNPPPTAEDHRVLRGLGWSDDEIKEIAYMAFYSVYGNRITTLLAIPLDLGAGLERWYFRLLRPFLARFIRSRERQGRPGALPTELRHGPYAYLGLALDGLPCATALQELQRAAWEAPALAPRVKALVFAVVARGLGSRRAEREAVEILGRHGLDEGQVEEILTHLSSPKLDPIEAAIVPFARETIWVQPAEIQRRGRELLDRLTPEQLVELAATAGLANSSCRLSLALVEAE